jgi:hypothetical protein
MRPSSCRADCAGRGPCKGSSMSACGDGGLFPVSRRQRPTALGAASPLGALACGQCPECPGWACGPPVPAACHWRPGYALRAWRQGFAETAGCQQRLSAAPGKPGRGRPRPGRTPGSAGFPPRTMVAPERGCVRPQRAVVGGGVAGMGRPWTPAHPAQGCGGLLARWRPPFLGRMITTAGRGVRCRVRRGWPARGTRRRGAFR